MAGPTDDGESGVNHFQSQPRRSAAELHARIADADEVLAWAAAHPSQAGSLAAHTLSITKTIRDHAAADLAARELLERITSRRSS